MTSQEYSALEGGGGSEKSKKYDRQLRLWGDHGQLALEMARICLVNATATGTEILKNLILPGVGAFTIVDGKKVTGEDIGCNFFLEKESIGKSRAQLTTELLQELNEDVNGDFVEEHVEDLLDNNPHFFTNFSLVIASGIGERAVLKLAGILWDSNIPLLVCVSYGMVGYIRLVVNEHTVVESHPDNAHEDLRLDRPFPGFVSFCDSLDLTSMSKKDHSHTPWLVILYKYLMEWKSLHNGEGPRNYKEKNQLKEMIRQGMRKNEEGVPEEEENFDEAIRFVNSSLVQTKIPDTVKELFSDDACKNLTQDCKPFWILVQALKEYVENEGQGALPLRGSIPDMTADSERYIQLQNVFKEQANQDIATVTSYVHQILQTIGRKDLSCEYGCQSSPRHTHEGITESDIRNFCKNASFLRRIRCRSLADEYNVGSAALSELAMQLEDTDEGEAIHYVMLRAVLKFHEEYSRYPGCYEDSMEADVPKLKTCLGKLLQEWGLNSTIRDDYAIEYCRWGGSELHSVAAYIGGAAAQEAIKILTSQFVPINNTFLYNAIKQTSVTLQM